MAAATLHVPVLLDEVLANLPVPAGGRVLDLTLGLGGHAEALLARSDAETRYLGVDRDPEARARATRTAEDLSRLGQQLRGSLLRTALRDLLAP